MFVDGAVAVTYATLDSTRHVGGRTATAEGEATGAGIVAGLGLVLHAGPLTLEPRIGLDYDHNRQDGFTERGAGAANLRVGQG
jgi:subtilase-type serine protease